MTRIRERMMAVFGSFRLNRRAVTALSLLGAFAFLGVCLMLLRAGARDTVTIGERDYSLLVEDEADVEDFLTACGYIPEGCVSDRTITVPKTWNGVYAAYQELQKGQGLTLVPYKGKEARELIYASAQSEDYAAVLISGGRIIAAHRSTMLLGDEPKPLIVR